MLEISKLDFLKKYKQYSDRSSTVIKSSTVVKSNTAKVFKMKVFSAVIGCCLLHDAEAMYALRAALPPAAQNQMMTNSMMTNPMITTRGMGFTSRFNKPKHSKRIPSESTNAESTKASQHVEKTKTNFEQDLELVYVVSARTSESISAQPFVHNISTQNMLII